MLLRGIYHSKPGLIFPKGVWWAFFGRGLYVMKGSFVLWNGFGLTVKTALNSMIKAWKSLTQLTLTVHGLIFGGAYYQKDICV